MGCIELDEDSMYLNRVTSCNILLVIIIYFINSCFKDYKLKLQIGLKSAVHNYYVYQYLCNLY